MPEHPGFDLQQINDRCIVRLRVRPGGVDIASEVLQLPQALRWRQGNPAVCWLGPDQWLFTSNTRSADEIIRHIDSVLSAQLHAATDMSSGNVCFTLKGPAIRKVLTMGCGIDLHPNEFKMGQCVRTHFALVPLFIVAVKDCHFDLYLDRSYALYLGDWFANAGQDPITLTEC